DDLVAPRRLVDVGQHAAGDAEQHDEKDDAEDQAAADAPAGPAARAIVIVVVVTPAARAIVVTIAHARAVATAARAVVVVVAGPADRLHRGDRFLTETEHVSATRAFDQGPRGNFARAPGAGPALRAGERGSGHDSPTGADQGRNKMTC